MFSFRQGLSAFAVATCALVAPVHGQVQRADIPAAGITTTTPQLATRSTAPASRELTVRWTIEPQPGDAPTSRQVVDAATQRFELESVTTVGAPMVRQRAPELAVDHLLVMASGPAGDLGWQLIRDPRILRAETPGPDGTLTGQVLYRPATNFLVSLPDGLAVTALRIYQIDWTGVAFVLRELGTLDVPAQ